MLPVPAVEQPPASLPPASLPPASLPQRSMPEPSRSMPEPPRSMREPPRSMREPPRSMREPLTRQTLPASNTSVESQDAGQPDIFGDTDDRGFERLEMYARQWLIATFSNKAIDEPIQEAFPGMSANHAVFRNARKRVRDLYKSFKKRTLTDASLWFKQWATKYQNARYLNEMDFRTLKVVLSKSFSPNWLKEVFAWAHRAVNFDLCSPDAKAFLKCKSALLSTYIHLTFLMIISM